ncbi:glycosyltransferase family 25 protein [Desulfogranum japonicum]|uniref:hypothetical protein n=1 Tax=Desulfogranum japonicum TaxID=231447 RepID=UPI0004065A92|nr:hypothetical protein [Desulfogranum japonicum]
MQSPEDQQTDSWSFFDSIICITLQERPDRYHKAHEQFSAVGLEDRVEFLVVDKHPKNREQGIFESHRQCILKALESEARTLLIFEDDVFFKNFSAKTLQAACNYLKTMPTWDMFLLGGITSGSRKTASSELVTVQYRCLAHAYALNRSFAETLADKKFDGTPWDEMLRRTCRNAFAIYPMCAYQGLQGSDNQTVIITWLRQALGGLPFIQRANELYQNHKLLFTAFPLIVLLLLTVSFLV